MASTAMISSVSAAPGLVAVGSGLGDRLVRGRAAKLPGQLPPQRVDVGAVQLIDSLTGRDVVADQSDPPDPLPERS